jgi:hypothetical protein
MAGGKRHRVGHDAVDDQRGANDTRARDPAIVARPDAGEDLDDHSQKGLHPLRARFVGSSFGAAREGVEDVA